MARDLQKLCHESGASLILNDHADVAAIVGSAGLHVGQTDLPVEQARLVLAPHQVLGRSNHEIEELVESERMGADHVAFGAIYHTDTKGVGRPPQGIDQLRLARDAATTPLVAIGGINAENAAPVLPQGTIIHLAAWHDNTASNPANPDPTQWVGWGQRSFDDMYHAHVNVTYLTDEDYEQIIADRRTRKRTDDNQ